MMDQTLPLELMHLVVTEMGEKKMKQWTTISFLNRYWRETYHSLLSDEKFVRTLFTKEQIPILNKDVTIRTFLRDNEGFRRGSEALRLASFHPIYCRVLGLEEWISSLKEFKIVSRHYYELQLGQSDYALSVYQKQDHEKVMQKFHLFSVQEKLSYITTLYDFDKHSSKLDGAIAHPVTGSSQIGYLYVYKKPKKSQRNLFIMTKPDQKKIYLNGLSSVYDDKRIKKNAKLFHIKSKQHDWSKRVLGSGGGYTRGMDLIELFKPHLLKCQPLLRDLAKFRTLYRKPKSKSK